MKGPISKSNGLPLILGVLTVLLYFSHSGSSDIKNCAVRSPRSACQLKRNQGFSKGRTAWFIEKFERHLQKLEEKLQLKKNAGGKIFETKEETENKREMPKTEQKKSRKQKK